MQGGHRGDDDVEPLDSNLWFERLEAMARGDLGTLENSLRHAFHLVQLAPTRFRRSVHSKLEEDSFEALLVPRPSSEGWCSPPTHPCLPKGRYAPRQPLSLH